MDELEPYEQQMAQLAELAYKDHNDVMKHTYDSDMRYQVNLSDKYHKIFARDDPEGHDLGSGTVYLAIRGTNPHEFRDLTTDAALFANLESFTDRYKKAQQRIDSIKRQYPTKKIVITGHSLGGSIAHDLGIANKLESHAFNPGSQMSQLTVVGAVKSAIIPERNHVYLSGNDPISILHRLHGKHKRISPKHPNPHTIKNFL